LFVDAEKPQLQLGENGMFKGSQQDGDPIPQGDRQSLGARRPVPAAEILPKEVWGRAAATVPVAESPVAESELSESDLKAWVDRRLPFTRNTLYADAVEVTERYLFARVLQATNGNQSKAAEILGITRGKLRDRIAAFGIAICKVVNMASATADRGKAPLGVLPTPPVVRPRRVSA